MLSGLEGDDDPVERICITAVMIGGRCSRESVVLLDRVEDSVEMSTDLADSWIRFKVVILREF